MSTDGQFFEELPQIRALLRTLTEASVKRWDDPGTPYGRLKSILPKVADQLIADGAEKEGALDEARILVAHAISFLDDRLRIPTQADSEVQRELSQFLYALDLLQASLLSLNAGSEHHLRVAFFREIDLPNKTRRHKQFSIAASGGPVVGLSFERLKKSVARAHKAMAVAELPLQPLKSDRAVNALFRWSILHWVAATESWPTLRRGLISETDIPFSQEPTKRDAIVLISPLLFLLREIVSTGCAADNDRQVARRDGLRARLTDGAFKRVLEEVRERMPEQMRPAPRARGRRRK